MELESMTIDIFGWKILGCLLLHTATCLHARVLTTEDLSFFPMVNSCPGTRVHFIPWFCSVSLYEPFWMNQIKSRCERDSDYKCLNCGDLKPVFLSSDQEVHLLV